jgi:hypothetical protein
MRPINHLAAANKLYPNAWKMVEQFRLGRGRDLPKWPGWCFMPMAGWYTIVCEDAGTPIVPSNQVPDIGRMAAIGTWRYSKGVYRFDPDVFASLWSTSITGNLPSEVLLRLPQWCIYIETPDKMLDTNPMYGYWCHLEWDANDQHQELRLLLDTESILLPIVIHLGDWPLETAIQKAVAESTRHIPNGVLIEVPDQKKVRDFADVLTPMLALVLYLCSDNPDYGAEKRPQRPRPKRTKKGWRLFAPPGPTIWRIGERIGQQIRATQSVNTAKNTDRTVRPHIRSAHWHGFWSGPRSGPRKYNYRWLPPIPVKIDK